MASLNSQTQLHNSISQYQDTLAAAANAILFSVKNFNKNITFQGSCKDWESLPSISSDPGDCYWVRETNEIAVWDGVDWVRMDSTSVMPEWHEIPYTFSSPDYPGKPKSEEEKLNDMADALTLLALS